MIKKAKQTRVNGMLGFLLWRGAGGAHCDAYSFARDQEEGTDGNRWEQMETLTGTLMDWKAAIPQFEGGNIM